jgi:DNA-binding response OmpR family regulator
MTGGGRILLVEDRSGECELFHRALEQAEFAGRLSTAPDAEAAFKVLEVAAETGTGALPWLIVLDLKLASLNGLTLLRRIRQDSRFAHVPVVMLTTSDDPHDMQICYEAGANGYVVKPGTFAELVSLVTDLSRFWLIWNRTHKSAVQC